MNQLFSEIAIGNLKIKNRIVMPPMVCMGYSTPEGRVTEKHVAHYQARAKGGVGLIIVEATCVNRDGRLAGLQLGIWSDEHIEGLRKIAEVCHQEGAKVLIQLHHAGLKTPPILMNNIIAPSAYQVKSNNNKEIISARALSVLEIRDLQADFVAAAMRAKRAGFDGVELHGAHSYLISQFFSPMVNKRDDEYGGSIPNRARFATEIIHSIREAAGDDFIISCRMGCNEPDLESSVEIAKEIKKSGVDLLHISFGMVSPFGMTPTESSQVPEGFKFHWVVFGGIQIKKQVNIPVIGSFFIKTPEQAKDLIENNLVDFTAIGRGLLVDPEWANKAERNENVTTCLSCKFCKRFRSIEACPRNESR